MAHDDGGATRLMRGEGGDGESAGGDGVGVSHGEGRLSAPPGRLIRTMEGHITSWSADMQRRYGFTSEEAHGRTSHQLLRTIFPQALQAIEGTLQQRNSWSGGVIHRHADGRAVMAANYWYVYRDIDRDACLVTEVHSDIAPDGGGVFHHLADVLAALARELSEPLTAINNYVAGVQLILQHGWPDRQSVREAMAQASGQVVRGAAGVNLLRHLANDMRATS
jgi:two-component system sensor kinase FixL